MTTTPRGAETTRLALAARAELLSQGWQPGDRLSDAARDAVAELGSAVDGLIYQAALRRSRVRSACEVEDLVQSLWLDLPAVALRFDPSHEVQFNTFFRDNAHHLARKAFDREARMVRVPMHALYGPDAVPLRSMVGSDVLDDLTCSHDSEPEFVRIEHTHAHARSLLGAVPSQFRDAAYARFGLFPCARPLSVDEYAETWGLEHRTAVYYFAQAAGYLAKAAANTMTEGS